MSSRDGIAWTALLGELMSDPDPQKSKRVMEAMLKMKKIDMAALKKAYDEQPSSVSR